MDFQLQRRVQLNFPKQMLIEKSQLWATSKCKRGKNDVFTNIRCNQSAKYAKKYPKELSCFFLNN